MRSRSLAYHVSVYTAAVIAASMAIYAAFQYVTTPGITVRALVIHHAWHVVALGILVYLILEMALPRLLIRPLRTICRHLAAGRVDHRYLKLDTPVTELQDIIRMANMTQRMQDRFQSQTVQELRSMAVSLKHGIDEVQRTRSIQRLAKLELLAIELVWYAQALDVGKSRTAAEWESLLKEGPARSAAQEHPPLVLPGAMAT